MDILLRVSHVCNIRNHPEDASWPPPGVTAGKSLTTCIADSAFWPAIAGIIYRIS